MGGLEGPTGWSSYTGSSQRTYPFPAEPHRLTEGSHKMKLTHGRYAQRGQDRIAAGRCQKCGLDSDHGAVFTGGKVTCDKCLRKAKDWRLHHLDHIRAHRGVKVARTIIDYTYFHAVHRARLKQGPVDQAELTRLTSQEYTDRFWGQDV